MTLAYSDDARQAEEASLYQQQVLSLADFNSPCLLCGAEDRGASILSHPLPACGAQLYQEARPAEQPYFLPGNGGRRNSHNHSPQTPLVLQEPHSV